MGYYVYILYSYSHGIYYKGFTENPDKRIWEHNNGLSRFTKGKGPWKMVYHKMFALPEFPAIRPDQDAV